MAGYVTGSIGSNDVLLKNMATEATMEAILEAISGKEVVAQDPKIIGNINKANIAGAAAQKLAGAAATTFKFALDKVAGGFSNSYKLIRGMDTNITNASWSLQALADQQTLFGKSMMFAASSVANMQEEFNVFSKMMQVGGASVAQFGSLREVAVRLGTDLQGLGKITVQYNQGLKAGFSSASEGLASLERAFQETFTNEDTIRQWGRLGIGVDNVSEQMISLSETQGGLAATQRRYGKNYSAEMLRTTRELMVMSGALGLNSKAMQDAAAESAKKIENKVFLATLSKEEMKQYQAMQMITGNAETATSVMRAIKTGFVDEAAATFLSTQGMAGFGKEMTDFFNLLKDPKMDFVTAMEKSGFLAKIQGMTPEQLSALGTQMKAYSGAMPEVAGAFGSLISIAHHLKGMNPDAVRAEIAKLTEPAKPGDLPKEIDKYTDLRTAQVNLAESTVKLNMMFNRLGLSIALGGTKAANSMVKFSKDQIKLLNEAMGTSFDENTLPDVINKKMDEYIRQSSVDNTPAPGTNANPTVVSPLALNGRSRITLKGNNGERVELSTDELAANKNNVQSTQQATAGGKNDPAMIYLMSELQNRINTLDRVTSLNDKYHGGKHGKFAELSADISAKGIAGKSDYEVGEANIAAIRKVLAEYGIEKDVTLINEMVRPKGKAGEKWTAPHIHLQFENPAAAKTYLEKIQTLKTSAVDNKEANDGIQVASENVQKAANDVKVASLDTTNAVNKEYDYTLLGNTVASALATAMAPKFQSLETTLNNNSDTLNRLLG